MRGADLRAPLFLTGPQLTAARGDTATAVPEWFDPPPHWRDPHHDDAPGHTVSCEDRRVLGKTFTWRGQQVRWDSRGSGPAVVFCHGTPWSAGLWEPIASALSSAFTVHLWDMPGYGTSTMAEGQDVSLAASRRGRCGRGASTCERAKPTTSVCCAAATPARSRNSGASAQRAGGCSRSRCGEAVSTARSVR